MPSIARRTIQHAYADLGIASPASRRLPAAGAVRVLRLIPRPFRLVFGESRTASWVAVIIVAVILLLLVRPVMMSLLSWHRTASVLNERRAEVRSLERRNAELEAQLEYYKSDAFVAERARQYGHVRPGETSFVVRELVHPESVARYAATQLRNAMYGEPVRR